ncbi:hypothetical protein BOX15_Mlig022740g1 [Macrostomum lignano]|nr:hypothetical protein BOX15_Mlig022740g1 [Macrostomum lignano]
MEIQVKKSRKVKGVRQKLKLFRASDPLKSVIMWGINYSMDQLDHVNKRTMLLPDDFKSNLKVKVDNHLFNKDSMPSKFKFKEYCPLVFADLRSKFGIERTEYLDSFIKRQPQYDASQGRSGSKFLCTYNRHYVIKTIGSEEVEQMHHILQAYHGYIVECSASTLLPQYLGMYRATVEDTEYYLLVTRCVFSPRLKIHRKYDLKGSTIDREASEKERSKELPTYKDVDFINTKERISIGESQKHRLLLTLRADVDFLQRNNLMDYSLLIGIHDLQIGGGFEDDPEAEDDAGLGSGNEGAAVSPPSAAAAAAAALQPVPEDSGDDERVFGGDGASPESPSAMGEGGGESGGGGLEPGRSFRYSAFLGNLDPVFERYGVQSSSRQLVYFLGIIDILTSYGVRKRTAQTYKSMKHGYNNENQLSTVRPEVYARRFLEFIDACIE